MTALLLEHALGLAENGWAVLPLGRNKLPRIGKHPECKASHCTGGCGREGHGVKDASSDPERVRRWWTDYPDALIGARVPAPFFVLDIDPRHDGHTRLAALEAAHEALPETLTVYSGRGDGGRHLYFLRPAGKLTEVGVQRELRRLGRLGEHDQEAGIDLKAAGYCVVPPSPHPLTGRPYEWEQRPPVDPPRWLVDLLVPTVPGVPGSRTPARPPVQMIRAGLSQPGGRLKVADEFSSSRTWAEVLEPHGWNLRSGDGDSDGSVWLHPHATSLASATVRHGCLFVYSSNTPFTVTHDGEAHGYTRFRAYAVLDHGGDLKAAARHLAAVKA